MGEEADVAIIGAGPAGLTAAIYAARFHLSVTVFDAGESRAASIPCSHNHAGFPNGVSGRDLLSRMAAQAEAFGVMRRDEVALTLAREGERLMVGAAAGPVSARAVLLATGVFNNRPPMDGVLHDEALACGALRYCPVCDGYEVTDQEVAVIGHGARGAREAIFLRSYTARVTLVGLQEDLELAASDRERLAAAGVRVIAGAARDFRLQDRRLSFACAGRRLAFNSVYPALGSRVRSDLAAQLGADLGNEGCIEVDAHQRTTATGLYAAGDVVIGLDQISHAMGQAGVAATTIRNDLAERTPLLR
jgi:thioredoxin reductase (NADPH)